VRSTPTKVPLLLPRSVTSKRSAMNRIWQCEPDTRGESMTKLQLASLPIVINKAHLRTHQINENRARKSPIQSSVRKTIPPKRWMFNPTLSRPQRDSAANEVGVSGCRASPKPAERIGVRNQHAWTGAPTRPKAPRGPA
jgi:hypothetical protein